MRLIDRLGRLPLVIVFGWAVAAALAVSVGVVGIGLVGSGLFGGGTEPLNETEVARALAAEESTRAPAPSGTPSVADSRTPEKTDGQSSLHTRGGTVVADCRRIISMSPAQGYAVHEQDDDEGEFRSVSDNQKRVKIDLAGCAAGLPRFAVAVESDDE